MILRGDIATDIGELQVNTHDLFWQIYGPVDEDIKILAKLRAVYSAVTLLWYAYQTNDQALLDESLTGLSLIKKSL